MMDLGTAATALLLVAVGAVATLYSAVGHGGATGYLAVMGIMSVPPAFSRPGALWLNCFVAAIAFWRFRREGCFDSKLFVPLACVSIPLAGLGSKVQLDGWLLATVLSLVLSGAGIMMFRGSATVEPQKACKPSLALPMCAGGVLGFLAGLTGIGGGVFLTPLLILAGWSNSRTAAGISALFILVNSIAGLAGLGTAALIWNPVFAVALALGIAGAGCGSWLGACHWTGLTLRRALSFVLWIAAAKIIITGS